MDYVDARKRHIDERDRRLRLSGDALRSVSLGFITSKDWAYWPVFLVPFAFIGFFLCADLECKAEERPAH
ncbi:MAG: hypothetical protein R3B89_34475 [Polyangiaceae bacterium]